MQVSVGLTGSFALPVFGAAGSDRLFNGLAAVPVIGRVFKVGHAAGVAVLPGGVRPVEPPIVPWVAIIRLDAARVVEQDRLREGFVLDRARLQRGERLASASVRLVRRRGDNE